MSYIVRSDYSFDLLSADGALRYRFICRLIQDGPRSAWLAHDSVTAVEEHSVDLATEANVAVIESLLLLLEQVC